MRFWFDTEFHEDGRIIDLISIGIVREDGATYYAESDFAHEIAGSSEWLAKNVRPYLTGEDKPRRVIAREIVEFADKEFELWAYYGAYDWVVLCQLYGRMIDLPKGWPMFCCDLKQMCVKAGNPQLPKQTSVEHNALADARWTKEAWEWLVRGAYQKN